MDCIFTVQGFGLLPGEKYCPDIGAAGIEWAKVVGSFVCDVGVGTSLSLAGGQYVP